MPLKDQYKYSIDNVTTKLVSGWVKAKKRNVTTPLVQVYAGETKLWEAKADLVRPDLKASGHGDVAFKILPSPMVLQKNLDEVDLYIDGVKVNEKPYPFSMKAPKKEDYRCRVDTVSKTRLVGWACYQKNYNYRPTVTLKMDGVVIGEGLADQFRDDLVKAKMGDGKFGFEINLNLAKIKNISSKCQVFVDGHAFPHIPVKLPVTQEAVDRSRILDSFGVQLESFEKMSKNEVQRLQQQIENSAAKGQAPSLNNASNVTIQNLAELTTRVKVLERALNSIITK